MDRQPRPFFSAYYLVDKSRQNNFREAFKGLKSNPNNFNDYRELIKSPLFNVANNVNGFKKGNGFKYLLSGPWPPYNFIILTAKPDPFMDSGMENFLHKVLKAGATAVN